MKLTLQREGEIGSRRSERLIARETDEVERPVVELEEEIEKSATWTGELRWKR